MGGCRCTFRGCPNSSDGVTHFFHYPVRNSDRCRQWISNANRPEFMCLSTPQLKNKVVCEQHFLAKMFMSPACDRLVHDAIPTEEGPPRHGEKKTTNVLPTPQIFAGPKNTIDELKKTGLDLDTSDVSSTTLLVSESPVLGLAFYSEDSEEKTSRMTPYTEALTRRCAGMSEIFKRNMFEKNSKQATNKQIKTIKQLRRVSSRNVLKAINSDTVIKKIVSPASSENKAKTERKIIEKIPDTKLSQNQKKILGNDSELKKSLQTQSTAIKKIDIIKSVDMIKSVDKIKSVDILKSVDEIKSTDTIKCVDEIKSTDTIKSVDVIQSTDLIKSADELKSVDTIKSVDVIQNTDLIKSADELKSVDTIKSVDVIQSTDSIKSVAVIKSVDKIKSVDTIKSVDAIKSVDLIKTVDELKSVDMIKSVDVIQCVNIIKEVENSEISSKKEILQTDPTKRKVRSLQKKFPPEKKTKKNYIVDVTLETTSIAPSSMLVPSDDILVIPLESDIQLLENSQTELTHFKKSVGSPKTILFGSDGTVSTTMADINSSRNNKNITILQTVPITFVPKAIAAPNETASETQLNIVDRVMQMIEKNSRDIGDLKNIIAQNVHQNRNKIVINSKSRSRKRKILPPSPKSTCVKKLKLYCDIVQYLSPSVAKLVHRDMFPASKR